MAIKKYKPTTPGRRGMTVTDYSVLSKVDPERSLLESKKKHAGRNNTGKITVRHHAAATASSTVSSTSSATSLMSPPPSRRWSMTRTVPPSSHSLSTRTAPRATSWLPMV